MSLISLVRGRWSTTHRDLAEASGVNEPLPPFISNTPLAICSAMTPIPSWELCLPMHNVAYSNIGSNDLRCVTPNGSMSICNSIINASSTSGCFEAQVQMFGVLDRSEPREITESPRQPRTTRRPTTSVLVTKQLEACWARGFRGACSREGGVKIHEN
jgi:hypothetical protein